MKKRLLTLLLALTVCLTLLPTAALAVEQNVVSERPMMPEVSANANHQSYAYNQWGWAEPVSSYLYVREDGNLTRVERLVSSSIVVGHEVVVEDYDENFQLQTSRFLTPGLPEWGGFFAGQDYNFIISGQFNTQEDDDRAVFMVEKYSKDWELLGSAQLRGANTTWPFRLGSLRCAEYGGYLYVYTCHKMYASRDKLDRQSNLMFCVRQVDMTITDARYEVSDNSTGYVPDSRDQFITIDATGTIVTLDHGSTHPRGLAVSKYYKKAGEETFQGDVTMVEPVAFPDSIHSNDTGCAVGGFQETTHGYLTAYLWNDDADREPGIYMSYINKDSFSVDEEKACTQLNTDKMEIDRMQPVPQMGAVDLNSGYILWNKLKPSYYYSDELFYVHYDGQGNVSAVRTATAPLSDCQPIAYRNGVVWYTTADSGPVFYLLDETGLTSHSTNIPLTEDMFTVDTTDELYTGTYVGKRVFGKDREWELAELRDYIVTYKNNVNVGTATITITGRGSYDGNLTYTFRIIEGLTKSMFTVDTSAETYTGKPITKSVYGLDGDTTLVEGVDYTVAYRNNINVGTAKLTITGMGDYTGTLTYSFTIKAKPSSGSGGSGGGSSSSGGSSSGGGGSSGGGSSTAIKPTETEKPTAPAFADVVKDSWYEAGVRFVADKGLFQGVAPNQFAPNINMTRAMLLTVLARLDGRDAGGGGTWYGGAVSWAMSQGISDGTMLDQSATREQLVTILYRYAKAKVGTADLSAFADGAKVSDWAKDAMTWAVSQGILTGKDGQRLAPQGTATRAEVATILQRFVEKS